MYSSEYDESICFYCQWVHCACPQPSSHRGFYTALARPPGGTQQGGRLLRGREPRGGPHWLLTCVHPGLPCPPSTGALSTIPGQTWHDSRPPRGGRFCHRAWGQGSMADEDPQEKQVQACGPTVKVTLPPVPDEPTIRSQKNDSGVRPTSGC